MSCIAVKISACLMIGLMAASCAARPFDVATTTAPAQNPLTREPLYAGLIMRAQKLKAQTDGFAPDLSLVASPAFTAYARSIRVLAQDNMAAHLDLKARGTDRDLKCILKGVALDLDAKIVAIETAASNDALANALSDMSLLLSDNVEVIATPATADSGLDCTIEFGA